MLSHIMLWTALEWVSSIWKCATHEDDRGMRLWGIKATKTSIETLGSMHKKRERKKEITDEE